MKVTLTCGLVALVSCVCAAEMYPERLKLGPDEPDAVSTAVAELSDAGRVRL